MNIKKDEKGYIIWWIDRKFMTENSFPKKCLDTVDGLAVVNKKHLTAYKRWGALSNNRKDIKDWIDTWLTKEEKEELKAFLKRRKSKD
ncbi:hypothetical protein [Marinobacterium sp. MBR-109]|jgi:hypothetical protein|uniref:hypothetical protein n=1 Tax=Marinobacterium sp. MBR-109 TaxID=3156462 RepID=UPI0033986C7B